ncbi:peptide ABC transporter substrate-binding protein [Tissierella sp. MSJ-40]|uniref:Peptide ABC transporter substrate-binding protein n=1 Tax=Tissierella simiarum TaxID=2841534 RepID=A0ABS6E1Z5_9FIRM|nr:peptide ABC transporter substrate-binding protein [Tissierella simiarum]MBU5436919.1 peptide ABC transporter substrate-binding protein [Tissierella simiarum]
MKKFKKLLALMLIIAMTMSILAGCGKKTQDVTKEEEEVEVEKAESTGPKVYRKSGMSTDTLNPHVSDSTSESYVMELIYGNLLDLIYDKESEGLKFIPNHAEALPTTEDGITWVFKLKKDIKWTDGTPIDANSYVWSWKMLLDPELINSGARALFDTIPVVNALEYFKGEVEWEEVGIKALDDYTLEIKLETQMPEIDVLLTFSRGYQATTPVHKELYEAGMKEKVKKEGEEDSKGLKETDYATSLEKTPSSGTYKLTEWVRDQHKVYEKNTGTPVADYYTPDRIEERVISENSTRIQLFEKGELEAVSVTGDDYEKYAEDPRIVFQEANTVWGFYINGKSEKNPILQNKDLRKALFYGINRDAISKGVFKVYASSPYYISTPCMVGDWKEGLKYRDTEKAKAITPEGSGYNPELAKEYFEKAYAANGNKKIQIEIIYFEAQETMKRLSEVAEEEYEKLFGSDKLDITLRAMPPMAAYDTYENGDYDMGIGARGQNTFNAWKSMVVWTSDFPNKTDTMYNKEFDELFKRTTQGDLMNKPEERIEALVRMEEILMDEIPLIPIFQNNNAVMYQDRIKLITGGKYMPEVGFAPYQAEILDQ